MKFLDEAKIYVKSGDGGNGCVSFHREKFVEFGGPDGGDGGRGGHIIFEVVSDVNTLIDFRYTQHFRARNGDGGAGRHRSGSAGEDLVIRIPVGTEILSEDKETVLYDLVTPGERITFLKGGDGGFGNLHYKTATNQAPRKRLPGWPGSEEVGLWLRLKLIAHAGLLGMPNAGKSTFLSRVSAAKPKIADYPFTTLHPNLGVVRTTGREFVIADIPGLIEGASEGAGLGTRFLGHVERTSVLIHLVDITQDDPAAAYKMLRKELKAYGGGLYEKKQVIALNKADALGPELSADVAKDFAKKTKTKPYIISGVSGEGMDALLKDVADIIFEG